MSRDYISKPDSKNDSVTAVEKGVLFLDTDTMV